MKINLTLPTSWGTCTIEQLEQICMAQQVAMQLPADQQGMAWKVECFLRLAGLEVMEEQQKDEQGESFVVVRRSLPKGKENATAGKNGGETGQGEFRLYLWQIQYWVSENLAFLDTPPNVVRFPYPEWECEGKKFRGPSIYLSGWTWQQYRLLKDYLDYFFKVEERSKGQGAGGEKMEKAMGMVLATLYDAETDYLDETTRLAVHGFHYRPEQSTENAKWFEGYPAVRFAVILMWWATVAMKLQKDYPKCFSSGNQKKHKIPRPQDPIAEYARTTATLEKYMGVNEQELQQESFTVVLQHLQDMIKQNEEIERMNQRMKSKK